MTLERTGPVVGLQPPGACTEFTRSDSRYPPLGLCSLAATVAPDEFVVVDSDALDHSADECIRMVLNVSPSAVAMTVTSYTTDLVERFAAALTDHGVPVIVGGPAATLAPREVLRRCPSVDCVFVGEGEPAFPEIVARLRAGRSLVEVPGVMSRGTECVPKPARPAELNVARLDSLPFDRYWCPDARRRPMVTMATTRGCPHRCGFCSSPQLLGKKVRALAVEVVVAELKRLQRQHGIREVSFVDDVFTIRRDRTLALCRAMVEAGLDLTWFCNARADQVTPELAEAMAAAGCHQVYLGFESGAQSILDEIQKGATVAELETGAAHLAAAGIHRSVGFVIGLPGETDGTVERSIELAQRVRPERLQFTRFTPLPGSPLAGLRSDAHNGFHGPGDGREAEWIKRCYTRTTCAEWGHESW